VNLRLSKVLTPEQVLAGNIYYRGLKSNNVSSNVNDAFTAFPCPAVSCPATLDQSSTDQAGSGATLQYTLLKPLRGHDNKFTVGVSLDYGDTRFTQFQQDATFTNDRNTVGVTPFAPLTDVQTVNRYYGLYLTDTYSLNSITYLTLSGRYNRARVNITDRSGSDPGER
jgi:hypothetical protein